MNEPCIKFAGQFGVLVWPDSRDIFLRSVESTLEAAREVARGERGKGYEAVDICLFLEREYPSSSAEEAEAMRMEEKVSLEFEDGRTE